MKKFLWNFISVLILFLSTSAWPATWPARQAPDWDLGLQTWLYVGHNSDGTLKGSVSQGEWDQNGATGTYVDPYIDRFTVPGDMTAEFQAGRAVWSLLTGTDCYSTVASATYTTLTTVILNDSCIDNTVSHVTWGIISAGTITSLPILPLDIIPATLTGKNADMVDGYDAGNAAGNVPVSNGVLNTNLNADMVDGMQGIQHQSTEIVVANLITPTTEAWTNLSLPASLQGKKVLFLMVYGLVSDSTADLAVAIRPGGETSWSSPLYAPGIRGTGRSSATIASGMVILSLNGQNSIDYYFFRSYGTGYTSPSLTIRCTGWM